MIATPPWSQVPDPAARRRASLAAGLVALAWVALALPLLPEYGPTWDAVLGDYPHGEGILRYLGTGDPAWLDLGKEPAAPAAGGGHPDFGSERFGWYQVYALAPTLSALSCRLFFTELGWLPALAAHHLPVVLLVALLVFLLVRTATLRWSAAVGIGAALLLLTAPRFFAHAFNNLKDVPETVLYCAALLAGWTALRRGGLRWWTLTGVVAGLALAQKANALFVPVHLGLFLLLRGRRPFADPAAAAAPPPRVRDLGLAGLAGLATWVAASPPFWSDPLPRIARHLAEMFRVGNTLFDDATGPATAIVAHGPLHVLWTTPLPLLAAAALGFASPALRRDERLFLGLAVAVPVARTFAPGMRSFDGVRHFLEFLPPLCLLGGLGVARLAGLVGARAPRIRGPATAAVLAALVFPSAAATLSTHPNGICWFNGLIGGLPGAQRAGIPEASDYWGNSLWQGLDWINAHAEPGATLLVPTARHVAGCGASVKLRSDVRLLGPDDPPPEGPLYVMSLLRRGWSPLVVPLVERFVEPVHEIRVQDAPILRIHVLRPRPAATGTSLLWRLELEEPAAGPLRHWLAERPERVFPLLEALGAPAADAAERLAGLRLPAPVLSTARSLLPPRTR